MDDIIDNNIIYTAFGNNNLSIVVLTQNNLCNIIPNANKYNAAYINDILNIYAIGMAALIVIITSAIARPKNL